MFREAALKYIFGKFKFTKPNNPRRRFCFPGIEIVNLSHISLRLLYFVLFMLYIRGFQRIELNGIAPILLQELNVYLKRIILFQVHRNPYIVYLFVTNNVCGLQPVEIELVLRTILRTGYGLQLLLLIFFGILQLSYPFFFLSLTFVLFLSVVLTLGFSVFVFSFHFHFIFLQCLIFNSLALLTCIVDKRPYFSYIPSVFDSSFNFYKILTTFATTKSCRTLHILFIQSVYHLNLTQVHFQSSVLPPIQLCTKN